MTIVRQTAALSLLLFGSCGTSVFALASAVSHELPHTVTTTKLVRSRAADAGKDDGRIGTVAQKAALAAENAKEKTTTAALLANAAIDDVSSKVAADIERAASAAYEAAEEAIHRSRAAHTQAVMRAPTWVICAQDTAEKSATAAREALTAASVSVQKSMQSDEEGARLAAQQARVAIQEAANAALAAASAAKGVWDEERSCPMAWCMSPVISVDSRDSERKDQPTALHGTLAH